MTSYKCLFIIAVCRRYKANLATPALSKREPDLFGNDGDNSDDGNEGDDDHDDESDEDQEVIIASKHLVLEKEVRTCLSSKVTIMRPLNVRISEYKYEILFDAYS